MKWREDDELRHLYDEYRSKTGVFEMATTQQKRKPRRIASYALADVKRDRKAGVIPEENKAFRAHVEQRAEEFAQKHADEYCNISRAARRSSYDAYYVWAYLHPECPF